MKRFRVWLAGPAEAEIEEAHLYIRQDSPENPAKWRIGLLEAAVALGSG